MPNTFNRVVGGACTASKQEKRYPENYPKYFTKGEGAYVYDNFGNEYLDFVCGLGAISLGYSDPSVDNAVFEAIKRGEGTVHSLPNKKERALAELLFQMIPSAEMTRFATNGVDVTSAAIRLARYITGRETVLSFSYHGCSDVFMACTKANAGVPGYLKKTIIDFDYNDEGSLKRLFRRHKVAAVIMEPHTIRKPNRGYLDFVRDICSKNGTLLIYDEVVSFPRYPKFSAQSYFMVYPDLTCISKGMANGYPISALCGRGKYMKHLADNDVFFSTTFGGNNIGVTAALTCLNKFLLHDVPYHMEAVGSYLKIKDNPRVKLVGYPWRQFLECSDEDRQKIWQEMIKRGVFMGVPIFINWAMRSDDMTRASDHLNNIIDNLDNIKLEGRRTSEVFRKK